MKISVRFQGLPASDAVRGFIERQALFHLSRFGHDVATLEIRIRDVNGPRGGNDMECRMAVTGPRIGFTTITELSDDAYQSVGTGMTRLARAVARALDRSRTQHVAAHPTS